MNDAPLSPDPARPHSYPRRALVCLVGLTPQVVTETLYALVRQEQDPFLPTELHIVSTARGARIVHERLVAGGEGPLQRLQREWLSGHAPLRFDAAQHLHVVQRGGEPLDDIESVEDNAAIADTLLEVLRPLARDPACAIHASIAGGRKSMGFYLGYAMSLLGRPQDRLSHVLVNAPFEGHRDFFYPEQPPRMLPLDQGGSIATSEARIVLAPVAFVRIVDGLRAQIETEGVGFEALIRQAQAALTGPVLQVAPAAREVRIGRDVLTLEPALMAWYCFFALRRQRGLRESERLDGPGMVRVHREPVRCIGFDQTLLDLACRRVGIERMTAQTTPEELRSRVSTINSALKRRFGVDLGTRVAIAGPRERGKRDGQYGMAGLSAQSIQIL